MKVGVLHFHRLGGSGVVAYEVAKTMVRNYPDVEFYFIGLRPPFRFDDGDDSRLSFKTVYVENYPAFDYYPYTLSLASQVYEYSEQLGLDIIHAHYAIPYSVSADLAKKISKNRLKTVTTLHGTDITVVGNDYSLKHVTKYAIEQSDAVTCVSRYLKDETIKNFDVESDKLKVIHNFIDVSGMLTEAEKEMILSSDRCKGRLIVTHISNYRGVKNPLDVILIFDGICKKMGNNRVLELWLVGDGPMIGEMQKLVRERGLVDRVKFWGVRVDIESFLKKSHLFLLTSNEESFGLVLLEAMLERVPCIACRAGGVVEVIDHGESGYLYDKGNLEEAVDLSVSLLESEEKRRQMSQKGAEKLRTRFNADISIKDYYQVYENLLKS